jgi:hypothetical protein
VAGTVEAVLWILHPRWLATHLLLVATCVAMVLLGRWQWDVADSGGSGSGSLLNYGYALQWWLFTGFAVFIWFRLVRDRFRRGSGGPSRRAMAAMGESGSPSASKSDRVPAPRSAPYRVYAMPQAGQISETDPELAAYNAYLSDLHPTAPVGEPTPASPGRPGEDDRA